MHIAYVTKIFFATQHAMPSEFGRKWGTECLNTRFPLPTPTVCGIGAGEGTA